MPAIKLRRKAPFWCRHRDAHTGELDHLTHALSDTDGDMCPEHTSGRPSGRTGPIWPLNDDGSICSPTPARALEAVA